MSDIITNMISKTNFLEKFLKKFKLVTDKKIKKIELSSDEETFDQISELFFSFITVNQDLQTVINFLKINPDKILEYFPFFNNEDEYYKYHYENFIIRTITISDLIGKIGNRLFSLGITEYSCNAHTFNEKYKKTDNFDSNLAKNVEDILFFIKTIKKDRNLKIHSGKTNTEKLNNLKLYLLLRNNLDHPDYKKHKEEIYNDIKSEIKIIELEVIELCKLTNTFFDIISAKI